MALQSSGAISLGDVNIELGNSSTAQISLNDAAVRSLFGVATGTISLSDGYGASSGVPRLFIGATPLVSAYSGFNDASGQGHYTQLSNPYLAPLAPQMNQYQKGDIATYAQGAGGIISDGQEYTGPNGYNTRYIISNGAAGMDKNFFRKPGGFPGRAETNLNLSASVQKVLLQEGWLSVIYHKGASPYNAAHPQYDPANPTAQNPWEGFNPGTNIVQAGSWGGSSVVFDWLSQNWYMTSTWHTMFPQVTDTSNWATSSSQLGQGIVYAQQNFNPSTGNVPGGVPEGVTHPAGYISTPAQYDKSSLSSNSNYTGKVMTTLNHGNATCGGPSAPNMNVCGDHWYAWTRTKQQNTRGYTVAYGYNYLVSAPTITEILQVDSISPSTEWQQTAVDFTISPTNRVAWPAAAVSANVRLQSPLQDLSPEGLAGPTAAGYFYPRLQPGRMQAVGMYKLAMLEPNGSGQFAPKSFFWCGDALTTSNPYGGSANQDGSPMSAAYAASIDIIQNRWIDRSIGIPNSNSFPQYPTHLQNFQTMKAGGWTGQNMTTAQYLQHPLIALKYPGQGPNIPGIGYSFSYDMTFSSTGWAYDPAYYPMPAMLPWGYGQPRFGQSPGGGAEWKLNRIQGHTYYGCRDQHPIYPTTVRGYGNTFTYNPQAGF